MSDDNALDRIEQANNLYRPFPAFVGWGVLDGPHRSLWESFVAEMDAARALATPEHLARSVEIAVRSAAIDTGAIEGLYHVDRGFTYSVATQALTWKKDLAAKGEGVREFFEAQLAAYELVIDAVTGQMPLNEAWLRSLHEQICRPQKTHEVWTDHGWQMHDLPLGSYKQVPNHVTLADGSVHAYAPVEETSSEMHRLMLQLRSTEFEAAHPAEQAAYAHFALVTVHPFADGNGRVARALASMYLYRSVKIPLVVFSHQRERYFDALEQADRGEPAAWLNFLADRGMDAMEMVVDSLRSARTPQPDEVAEQVSSIYGSRGRTQEELDNVAGRLLAELQSRCSDALRSLRAAIGVSSAEIARAEFPPPDGYRRIQGAARNQALLVTLRPPHPMQFEFRFWVRVNVALNNQNPFGFLVEAVTSDDRVRIRDDDVVPEISAPLAHRLDQWIRRQLGSALAGMKKAMESEVDSYR